ncbi:porin [Sphingomonas sp.]|uniref:porin n=1 Tax=Sphingomonas sp. TaxID=28214 RepID=UPI0035B205F4
MPNRSASLAAVLFASTLLTGVARAADAPASWASGITFGAQVQAGYTFNMDTPKLNFGRLMDDKPNTVLLNQVLLTAQRAIDPKSPNWDVGFKFQLLYGADARYTHFMGLFDKVAPYSRNQFDIVEANVAVHMPILTAGGIDVKLGAYATPIGFETIDPSTNPFYSHSYIFNFGLPLKHTGALAVVHATDFLDVYLGVDTGVNTTFGKGGDNNSALAGIGGFQLTLLEGKLTALALAHIGPENPSRLVPNANKYMRYLNDIVLTWKPNESWTLVTDLNYIKDDFVKADAFGIAQYVGYTLTPTVTLNARAELFADSKNFFVAAFPGTKDFVNFQRGLPATAIAAPKGTTYGALTVGFTWKPDVPIKGLMVRPELRIDRSMSGSKPFNNGTDRSAVTVASDVVLTF